MDDSLGVLRFSLGVLSTPEHPLATPLEHFNDRYRKTLRVTKQLDNLSVVVNWARCFNVSEVNESRGVVITTKISAKNG